MQQSSIFLFSRGLISHGLHTAVLSVGLLLLGYAALPAQESSSDQDRLNVEKENPATDQEAEIARLIKQLGHPSYRMRVQAEWALKKYGLAAFEQLHEASKDPSTNIEIANAANYLINSQSVIWYLDSDSVDVRGYLKDYDRASANQRLGRIKMLTQHASSDAILALCRLARFERTELLSRTAGVHLIQALTRKAREFEGNLSTDLVTAVDASFGSSKRDAVKWVRQFLTDTKTGEVDLKQWQAYCKAEREQASAEPYDLFSRQKQHVLDFHGAVAEWVELQVDRTAALAIARPCLALAEPGSNRLTPFAEKLLDDWKMPELLIELHANNQEAFEKATLGYYLAEAYLQTGQEKLAQEQALKASLSMQGTSLAIQRLRSSNLQIIEASQRNEAAKRLTQRSLFDWAEQEYRNSLKVLEEIESAEDASKNTPFRSIASERRITSAIRLNFAQFYWDAGRHSDAKDVLEPLAKLFEKKEGESEQERTVRQLTAQAFDENQLLGSYYYYAGLACNDSRQFQEAEKNLLKALEYTPTNPDIVIAMRDTAGGKPDFEKTYREKLDAMRDLFRAEVVKSEMNRANSPTREMRRGVDINLSEACNQLAWLLGKCEENPQEAVKLAERAVGLSPSTPAYLDTLGRCYLSAGKLEKALATQKEAVELAPYERLLVEQLREIEKAVENAEQEKKQ